MRIAGPTLLLERSENEHRRRTISLCEKLGIDVIRIILPDLVKG
jgi:hypothetical protein